MKAIFTIPPYAPYVRDLMRSKSLVGARLNTVMPLEGSLEEELERMHGLVAPKKLWIDLKCRQLRVSKSWYYDSPKKPIVLKHGDKTLVLDPSNPKIKGAISTPPWAYFEIDHKVKLDTSEPRRCYFSDGIDAAYVARVIDGNKLVMLDGPKKVVGTGESVNIMHPSLEIEGYFTEQDKRYIEAAKKAGIHTYMLSYVEREKDITDMLEQDPDAEIIAKIESKKGLEFVANDYQRYKGRVRLMAARGDLYVEVGKPHLILPALKKIIEADPDAIAASRIFSGLRYSPTPTCSDLCDVGFLMELGYNTMMVGDDICFNEDSAYSAVNILEAIANDYTPRKS